MSVSPSISATLTPAEAPRAGTLSPYFIYFIKTFMCKCIFSHVLVVDGSGAFLSSIND